MAWLLPGNLEEALAHRTRSSNVRVVCGGTDLFVHAAAKGLEAATTDWLDLSRLEELQQIERTADGLLIGAGVSASRIWQDERLAALPALQQAARIVGGWQIQNRASLGGNVANASPAADMVVPLVAYGAEVCLQGSDGARRVPIDAFILGPRQVDLRPDELLVALFVPERMLGARQLFLRHDQRGATDISLVSVALVLQAAEGRVQWAQAAVGAAGPKPFRLPAEQEQLWEGPLDADKLAELAARYAASSAPISDVRASAEYRRSLVGTFIKRAASQLLDESTKGER